MDWRAVAVGLLWVGCAGPSTESTARPPVTVVTTLGSACRGGERVVLSGELSTATILGAGCEYVLEGEVMVGSSEEPATLFIEAGVRILAQRGSSLVVLPGSQLFAEGLPDRPIVFTSDQPEGSRRGSDWSGITILGRAPVNFPGGMWAEDDTPYGGDDPEDDSGVLRYVRIEFAGPGAPDLPGALFLGGVGTGTVVDHVQVHHNDSFGVVVAGGTVSLGHLLVTSGGAVPLSWWEGWQGRGQWICLQADSDGKIAMAGGSSVDLVADPQSRPRLANVTSVGRGSGTGLELAYHTGLFLTNSLVMDHPQCVTTDATLELSDLDVRHSRFDCSAPFVSEDPEVDLAAWVLEGQPGNGLADLGDPAARASSAVAPDFSSSLVGGGVAADDFLRATNVQGCLSPDDDWTAGWTAYPVD